MTESATLIPSKWFHSILSTSTWPDLEQDLLSSAHELLPNTFLYGAMGFLLSDADWAALPGVTVQGVVADKPAVPPLPARPAPSDGTAGDDRRFEREHKEFIRLLEERAEITRVRTKIKETLLNVEVCGTFHSVAVGAGLALERIQEGPNPIFARLKVKLGTPDQTTYDTWSEVYRTPAENTDVSEWMRLDILATSRLTPYGQQLTDPQKLLAFCHCYRLSPAVMNCWRDYKRLTPLLADRNFADALQYIQEQEPNIRELMTPSDIGFSSPLAAIGVNAHLEIPMGVDDAPINYSTITSQSYAAPRTFTQEQLDQAVADAMARVRHTKPPLYCWLHGYNQTHAGSMCTAIVAGRPLRHYKRDSRAPTPPSMMFSHRNCDHAPRCISVEEAKYATSPRVNGQSPGNAIRPGDTPYSAP